MKFALIILNSILTVFFYDYIFDNGTLGLIVVIFSFIMYRSKNKVDKRFKEFLELIANTEYANIEEALLDYKEDKKYLKKLFDTRNTKLLEEFQKLKFTHKELDRFIDIQLEKNKFIEKIIKKRNIAYTIYLFLYIISFIPLIYIRLNDTTLFYKLYNGGYYLIFILSIIFIIFSNINLTLINHKYTKDLNFYDHYSLCFHKNCLEILNINDDRLEFDKRGVACEIKYKTKEKLFDFNYLIPLTASIIVTTLLM